MSDGMTTLHGVLSSHPVSGGGARGGDWSLSIDMLAYKLAGQSPVLGKFHARKPIDRADMDDWFAELRGQDTIAMTGRMRVLREDPLWQQFDMADYLGRSDDAEIVTLAAELAKPVTKTDPVLGLLTLDRKFEQFSGKSDFNGAEVTVSVRARGDDYAPGALEAVQRVFADAVQWDHRLRAFAATQLLDLKTDNWSSGKVPASADCFVAGMTPVCVDIDAQGQFAVDYSTGDMFLGHNILVTGTLDGGPTRAHL